MSLRTRIALCRLGFVLFCVLPTMLVAYSILWPRSKESWEADLAVHLGLKAAIESVSSTRPGVTAFQNVRFDDQESGLVAKFPSLEVALDGKRIAIHAPRAELQSDQIKLLHDLIHDRVLRKLGDVVAASVRLDEVAFHRSAKLGSPDDLSDSFVIYDVVAEFGPTNTGTRLLINLRPDQKSDSTQIDIHIERKNDIPNRLSTRWMLQTHGKSIPVSALWRFGLGVQHLGEDCRFRGMVWVERAGGTFHGDINGQLENVDLTRLVGAQFPHVLQGLANIELRRAEVRGGRLVNASGSFRCGSGQIGSTLLSSASKHLQMRFVSTPPLGVSNLNRMEFDFSIDGQSLSIRGQCDPNGTIIEDSLGRPLLIETTAPSVDTLSLVRTLVPTSAVQVPLTRETALLLGVLPLRPNSR